MYCSQKGIHHRSLCPKHFSSSTRNTPELTNTVLNDVLLKDNLNDDERSKSTHSVLAVGEKVLMQRALGSVSNPNTNEQITSRVFLDCGSQRSYITENLCKKLDLKPIAQDDLILYTFGSSDSKKLRSSLVQLDLLLNEEEKFRFTFSIVPKITGEFHRLPLSNPEIQNRIRGYRLADNLNLKEEVVTVDLLIGNDYYWEIIQPNKIEISPGLYLIESKLGWILNGRLESHFFSPFDISFISKETEELQDFWNLEHIGIRDSPYENDDDRAIEIFNKSIKFENNRYYVTWPRKDRNPNLPSNFTLSLGRLKTLLKTFKRDKDRFQKYDEIIQDQLRKGIIEKVQEKINNLLLYIPHHCVVTPLQTTTKVRIVYDASAKTKKENLSLNECLYRGPVLLEDLCAIPLRFRMNPIAIVADIEKAFLQIGLQEKDRDVTRFLWMTQTKKLETENNLQIYRFTRVPFGVISNRFLLGATVAYQLRKENSLTATKIVQNVYVDNVISGTATIAEARIFYKEAKAIFNRASMNLREWNSNSKEFLRL